MADIRAVRQELIEREAEPITDVRGGPESSNYWAYFRDSDGNVSEITERIQ